ncbi:acyltransferase [Gammaproteobacteria bacterium]|nr:acyltransferase [Gammaproteobacteria bacterium]
MKYRAEIDGLRALAVLPVILFHAGFEWFSGGFVGVDVFFVISGYLITTIIISEMAEGEFSIINFYERRARRILPALFFVMAVCIPFAWFWLVPSDLVEFGHSLIAVSTFSSNFLFWSEAGYFGGPAELKPLLHTWSLAVEEQYYILFPIFILLTWRLGIKWILIILSFIFILSLGFAQWGAYKIPSANFYLLPTRGWELLIGVFIAFYLKYNIYIKSYLANQLLSLLGFSMIIYSIIVFNASTPFPSLYALIPTIGTGLVILCATPQTTIHKLLSLNFIVGVGLISYSTYLWHQPILALARHAIVGEVHNLIVIILCISSLVFGWFSWRFIERPFRQKSYLQRKFIFNFSLIGILFFSIIGISLHVIDGGSKLYSLEKQKIITTFLADNSGYTEERESYLSLNKFDKTNNLKDILIIGDSHMQDIANAIYEAGLNEKYEFSSFLISINCGIYFIKDKKDIEDPKFDCVNRSFYNSNLKKQMLIADEIWIISSWKKEHVNKYMVESLENILDVNRNIKLFGTKSLGFVSEKWFLNNEPELWTSPIKINEDIKTFKSIENTNNSINKISKDLGVDFINTQHLICDGNNLCSNYSNGDIISYDGGHLTPHGANILGNKIRQILEN